MELGAVLDVLAEEALEDGEEGVEEPAEVVIWTELGERPGVVDEVDVAEPDGEAAGEEAAWWKSKMV